MKKMMKSAVLGVVAFAAIGLSVPANAADLAARPYTKAPELIVPVYDWSGFYVGLNGGGGSSRSCWDFVPPAGALTSEGCHNATGGTAGGLFGYRWQSMNWVFGVEVQANWADFSGDNISTLIPAQRNRSRIDAFGLFTGQVGYAWSNALLYVKGGAAVVDDRYDIFTAPGFAGAGTQLASTDHQGAWGGTVGAGLEYGIAPNWSVGIEYDHNFLATHTLMLTTTPGAAAFQSDRMSESVDMGLVRLNYKFGGPSIAKY
jgi:outer membrane immunogenic protein